MKLLISVFMVTVLCAGCDTKEQEQPKQEQTEKDEKSGGLRIDPLGHVTTPGRCVGLICF